MEKLDIIWRIAELLIAVVSASLLTRILTIRERVKQEKSNSARADAEAKAEQIENVKKVFIDLYQPVIDDLEKRLERMGEKVSSVEEENVSLKKEIAEVRKENATLKAENEELRDALREIRPDIVPSRKSANAKRQSATQPRGNNGQFVKKEGA